MCVEMPSACAQGGGVACGAAAQVLETLLSTRISISIAPFGFITATICIPEKGHHPLPKPRCGLASSVEHGIIGNGTAAGRRRRAAGTLHHFGSMASQHRVGMNMLRAEQRSHLACGRLVITILSNVGNFVVGRLGEAPSGSTRS